MLTENQIESHRTFGFVVLLQHVDAATVVALTEESDDALGDAFGARLADRSDPGGGNMVPSYPEAALFYGQTPLHCNDGTGVG